PPCAHADCQCTTVDMATPAPKNLTNPLPSNQHFAGPDGRNMDASLFKEFAGGERARLRFNMDFFNVFNRPGTRLPNSSGIITKQLSDNLPRVLQMTLRLSW